MSSGLDGGLRFFSSRILPHVEEAHPTGLRRSLHIDDRATVVTVNVDADRLSVKSCDELLSESAEASVRGAFDLNADLRTMRDVLSSDPRLEPLVSAYPDVRVPGSFDATETAIRAVVGQQVSVSGANTLAGRIVERAGERLSAPVGAVTHLFPTAELIAETDLDGLGMPGARIAAIETLAEAIADGRVDLDPDAPADGVMASLQSLRGIGAWTASYICMRVLHDRDAFLAGDLGVKKGAAALGLPTSPRELEAHSERWRPVRSYAVMYLWIAATSFAPI